MKIQIGISSNDPCTIDLVVDGAYLHIQSGTMYLQVVDGQNWNGPWNSALKLHAAGYLLASGGSLGGRGSYGFYWSRTQYDAAYGWYL